MRSGDKKLFIQFSSHTQLLNLRLAGLSVNVLARLYKCDRSTVRYNVAGIEPVMNVPVFGVARKIIQQFPLFPHERRLYKEVDGYRINSGKSYKEYLRDGK